MDKFLNEELFEVVLEKAFIEHEKEVLKSYPDDVELEREYPISKKEIRRFKNIVKEKEYGKKLIRVYFERAAVVVLCMISLFFALIMTTSPEVRAAVENVILKWYDKYTEFIFTESTTGLVAEEIEDVEIGYIPEKFNLEFEERLETQFYAYYLSEADANKFFTINVFINNNGTLAFDNESLEYENIEISGQEAWLMYDDEEANGGIVIVGKSITIDIAGYLSKEELVKIAENIK